MRKLLLLGAIFLGLAAQAHASTGAKLVFPIVGPQHTFTLSAARQLIVREQYREGFPLRNLHCFWMTIHRAGCEGNWTGTVLTGGQPEMLQMIDWVTRAGPCQTHVIRPIGRRLGIARGTGGRGYPRACFTGPLVVEVGPTVLD